MFLDEMSRHLILKQEKGGIHQDKGGIHQNEVI